MGIERGNEKGKDRKAERLWDDGMTEKEARARRRRRKRRCRGRGAVRSTRRAAHGRHPWCDLESA